MSDELAKLFSVFSDETRIKILTLLLKGEAPVSEISEGCNLTVSNTSHQLKILRTHKLVKSRKEGKYKFYSLDDDHVRIIIQYGIEHLSEM